MEGNLMSNYKQKIVNAQTGEISWRDYTAKEIAEVEAAQTAAAVEVEAEAAKEAARFAVLEKLGLTADEAAALLG
jgi:hypothetical protein